MLQLLEGVFNVINKQLLLLKKIEIDNNQEESSRKLESLKKR